MVCVVLTGTFKKCSVKYKVKAPAVSALKEVTFVILNHRFYDFPSSTKFLQQWQVKDKQQAF
jgi:hypothetical protein